MKYFLGLILLFFSLNSYSQTVQEVINQVSLSELTNINRELSGEDSTIVNGNKELILNRVNAQGNDLAADYIEAYLENLNLDITNHYYRNGGRNVIATQFGVESPENIIVVCGHYDAVANYCADDNISGVATVLETARILSNYCLKNTIVYALWDEEEVGLVGSRAYADSMQLENANIIAVLNMDMMAYDGNNDRKFDIDVRNYANSYAIRDTLLNLVDNYNFNLTPVIVDPGTFSSDHSPFWQKGFSAVLFGESWETNDQNPEYHSADDRVDLYNWPYYHDMAKLVAAYMATMGEFGSINTTVNSVFQTGSDIEILQAQFEGGSYQWYNCVTNQIIDGEQDQSFTPSETGLYAVILDNGICIDTSTCRNVVITSIENEIFKEIKLFPNPIVSEINLQIGTLTSVEITLYNVNGQPITNQIAVLKNNFLN